MSPMVRIGDRGTFRTDDIAGYLAVPGLNNRQYYPFRARDVRPTAVLRLSIKIITSAPITILFHE